jgi:putative AbiEi antitoxin of type IV toxin-antitoxin system
VAFAGRRHGVASWEQLMALGMTPRGLHTRVAAGRLHRIHRGVYALVGPTLLRIEGHWLAAVLAIGNGAVLSHRSAGALWGLLPAAGRAPEVSVARKVKPRKGIHRHCVRSLPQGHVTVKNAIPCATAARTIVDLAAVLPPRRLERVIGQAEVLKIYDRAQIEAILDASPRRVGTRPLRMLLGRSDLSTTLPRSRLEERFLALCDDGGLRRPELNVPYALPDGTEIVIDAFWRSAGLAVELDGRRYHSGWSAQVRDRRRDAQLTLAGLKPLRFTEADVTGANARATLALLRELVRRAA